jgi:hypothetical protein
VYGSNAGEGDKWYIDKYLTIQMPQGVSIQEKMKVMHAARGLTVGYSLVYNPRKDREKQALVFDVDMMARDDLPKTSNKKLAGNVINELATAVAAVAAKCLGKPKDLELKKKIMKSMFFLNDPHPEIAGKSVSFHAHSNIFFNSKAAMKIFWQKLMDHLVEESHIFPLLKPTDLDHCVLTHSALALAFRAKRGRHKKQVTRTSKAGDNVTDEYAALFMDHRKEVTPGAIHINIAPPTVEALVSGNRNEVFAPETKHVQQAVGFLKGRFPEHKIRAKENGSITAHPPREGANCFNDEKHVSNSMCFTWLDKTTLRAHCYSKKCEESNSLIRLPLDDDDDVEGLEEACQKAKQVRAQKELTEKDYLALLQHYQDGLNCGITAMQKHPIFRRYMEKKLDATQKAERTLELNNFLATFFGKVRRRLFKACFENLIVVAGVALLRLISRRDPVDKLVRWSFEQDSPDRVKKVGGTFWSRKLRGPHLEAKAFRNKVHIERHTFLDEVTKFLPYPELHKKGGTRASASRNIWGENNHLHDIFLAPYHSIQILEKKYEMGAINREEILARMKLLMEFIFDHLCSGNVPAICKLVRWINEIFHGTAQQATVPCLVGEPGVGKSLFANILIKALGHLLAMVISSHAALGDKFGFTSIMGNMLVVLEEMRLDDTTLAELRSICTEYHHDNTPFAMRRMNSAMTPSHRGQVGPAVMLCSNFRGAVKVCNNGDVTRRFMVLDISKAPRDSAFFKKLAETAHTVLVALLLCIPEAVLASNLKVMTYQMRENLQEQCNKDQAQLLRILHGIIDYQSKRGVDDFAPYTMNYRQFWESSMQFWYSHSTILHKKGGVSLPQFFNTAKKMLYLTDLSDPRKAFLDQSYTPVMQLVRAEASLEGRGPSLHELQQGKLAKIPTRGPPGAETVDIIKAKVLDEMNKRIDAWSRGSVFEPTSPLYVPGAGLSKRIRVGSGSEGMQG